MRLTPAVRALLLASALLFHSAASLAAQSDTWALTNARIQTVTRGVIEKGTILIRKGLIEAVGPTVTVPADARVIDLAGKTVTPGIFDLTSSLGLPAAPTPGGGGAPGGGAQQTPAAPRQGLSPERQIATEIRLSPTDVKPIRDAGITAVLVSPARGTVPRHVGAGSPAGRCRRRHRHQEPGGRAHRISGRAGGYPGTLLGVIAYQRQALFDAQRQGILLDRYKSNPRGMARPENDPGLDALVPVVRGQMPAFIDASNENEIAARFGWPRSSTSN